MPVYDRKQTPCFHRRNIATHAAPAALSFWPVLLRSYYLRPAMQNCSPSFINGHGLMRQPARQLPPQQSRPPPALSFAMQNGLFFLKVPPNVYDLIVSAPGFRSNMATGIFSGPGQTATVTYRLAPASTRVGTLQGRVTAAGATSGGTLRRTGLHGPGCNSA